MFFVSIVTNIKVFSKSAQVVAHEVPARHLSKPQNGIERFSHQSAFARQSVAQSAPVSTGARPIVHVEA